LHLNSLRARTRPSSSKRSLLKSPKGPFGLGDSRAVDYADVSSGLPPTGPDKDAGPAFVSLESGAGPVIARPVWC